MTIPITTTITFMHVISKNNDCHDNNNDNYNDNDNKNDSDNNNNNNHDDNNTKQVKALHTSHLLRASAWLPLHSKS